MLREEQATELLRRCELITAQRLKKIRGNLRKAESRAAAIWELLVILVVVLLVLGPNRLPGVARTMGKAIRTIKRASSSFTEALTREVESPPETDKSAKTDTYQETEKPAAYPGTVGAQKQESKPEKPEGQPPQNEQ